MQNFVCIKGRTEFLLEIFMQARHEKQTPWVSELVKW